MIKYWLPENGQIFIQITQEYLFVFTNIKIQALFCFIPDIDECASGQHDCDGGTECINRPGSYVCSCPSGYTRQGTICVGES